MLCRRTQLADAPPVAPVCLLLLLATPMHMQTATSPRRQLTLRSSLSTALRTS